MYAVRLLRSLTDCLVSVNQSSDEDGVATGNFEPVGTESDDEEDFNNLVCRTLRAGGRSQSSVTRAQLPATPTKVDPATGKLVATTAMGVKYFYRTHTAMGVPIAPAGYPGETAEQEVTRKRQREKDGTWGIFPNKWCGVRHCDTEYCTHIAR
jgi:hypothetical protein